MTAETSESVLAETRRISAELIGSAYAVEIILALSTEGFPSEAVPLNHRAGGADDPGFLRAFAGSAALAVLLDCGVRIGQALGLQHEDSAIAERHIDVVPRANDTRARAKGGRLRTIPASGELMRLYADYLTGEYGALDSDYVFVNLWGGRRGQPLTYPAVYDLVGRLRSRTKIAFGPHLFSPHVCDLSPVDPARQPAI